MQSVPAHLQRDLVASFAALEYKCKNGDVERGRTAFEGLHDTYPKRGDLWDQRVALEISRGDTAVAREVWERMSKVAGKKRRANFVFRKWMEFEEKFGDKKSVERVKAKAQEWVEKHKAAAEEEDGE